MGDYDHVFYDPEDASGVASLTPAQQAKVHKVRVMMANAYSLMIQKGYDALQFHSVNYKNLEAYQDHSLLERARKLPLHEGGDLYIEWCRRVEASIAAAIRRKGLRIV